MPVPNNPSPLATRKRPLQRVWSRELPGQRSGWHTRACCQAPGTTRAKASGRLHQAGPCLYAARTPSCFEHGRAAPRALQRARCMLRRGAARGGTQRAAHCKRTTSLRVAPPAWQNPAPSLPPRPRPPAGPPAAAPGPARARAATAARPLRSAAAAARAPAPRARPWPLHQLRECLCYPSQPMMAALCSKAQPVAWTLDRAW